MKRDSSGRRGGSHGDGDGDGDGGGDDAAHAGDALVELRRRVDVHFDAAVTRSPGAITCREGCHACCRPGLSVFGIEADRVAAALRRLAGDDPSLRARVRRQAADGARDRCALLVEGRCSVYAERPLICRSHGLAVRPPADSGEPRLDMCPLNYVGTPPPSASVLDLEALNRPLSVMARMWDGEGGRVTLADLAAAADSPARA